ncbi:hypothetical protein X777_12246, partial [Ooceraea biroi]
PSPLFSIPCFIPRAFVIDNRCWPTTSHPPQIPLIDAILCSWPDCLLEPLYDTTVSLDTSYRLCSETSPECPSRMNNKDKMIHWGT